MGTGGNKNWNKYLAAETGRRGEGECIIDLCLNLANTQVSFWGG